MMMMMKVKRMRMTSTDARCQRCVMSYVFHTIYFEDKAYFKFEGVYYYFVVG